MDNNEKKVVPVEPQTTGGKEGSLAISNSTSPKKPLNPPVKKYVPPHKRKTFAADDPNVEFLKEFVNSRLNQHKDDKLDCLNEQKQGSQKVPDTERKCRL
jgi:hypothetical protein